VDEAATGVDDDKEEADVRDGVRERMELVTMGVRVVDLRFNFDKDDSLFLGDTSVLRFVKFTLVDGEGADRFRIGLADD
jgi:hypothetical protein